MRYLFLGLLLFCSGCEASAKVLSQKAFTDEVIANIRSSEQAQCVRRKDDGSFTFGPDEKDCEAVQVFTDNTYSRYLNAPKDKAEQIELLIAVSLKAYVQLDEEDVLTTGFRDNLVAIVRPDIYLATLAPDGSEGPQLLSRPLAGDLHIILAHDETETLRMASVDLLTDAAMPESELFDLAFENAREKIGEISLEMFEGVELRSADSGLVSAELALPENCNTETAPYFASLFDRNMYMRVPVDQPARVSTFLDIHALEVSEGGILSSAILHCESGRWSAVEPSALQ